MPIARVLELWLHWQQLISNLVRMRRCRYRETRCQEKSHAKETDDR